LNFLVSAEAATELMSVLSFSPAPNESTRARARCSQSLFMVIDLHRDNEKFLSDDATCASLIGTRDYGLSDSVFKDRLQSAGPARLADA